MTSATIRGDEVNGSALQFRNEGGALIGGVLLHSGESRWFPGCRLSAFSCDRALVHDVATGLWGAITRQGDVALGTRYQTMTEFREERAFALDGTTVLVDTEGTVLQRYAVAYEADEFFDGLAILAEHPGEAVTRGASYGLVDRGGAFVIPTLHASPYPEEPFRRDDRRSGDGLVRVLAGDRYGYADQTGRTVIAARFEAGTRFGEGVAGVRIKGRWGFIDREESLVLPCDWEDARPFAEGLASVMRDGRWGAIDRKGRSVVPFEFHELGPFRDGHACARTDFGAGLIDRSGNFFVPPIYEEVTHFREGLARVWLQGTFGVLDRKLAVLWDDRVPEAGC